MPMPPALAGEVLRFWSEEDFNAAGRDLYTLGAIMAVVDEGFVPGARRAVRLQVHDRLSRTLLGATLQAGPSGMARVEFDNKEQLAAVLPEVLPPKTPPEPVEEGDRPRVTLTLPPSGELRNPTSASELLSLSLSRSLEPEDLEHPNIHLLLRWLLSTRGNVRVEIENADAPVHPFLVIGGREVRSSVAMPSLARGLVGTRGRYKTVEVTRPPRMTQSGTMLQLMQEVVSGLVSHFDDEALEAALRDYGARAPRLNAVGTKLLEGLGFSSAHKRLALKALTGRESVRSVTQHAAGARTAFEVLYTLEISGALDWVDAGGALREEKQRKEKERLDRLVEGAAGLLQKLKGANHFEVLGLHWSTPPRKILDAYRELKALYGPGGLARAEAPEVCEGIWAQVVRSYEVLNNQAERRLYRRQVYALKWSAQVELLIDRAKIAIYRKDVAEAADLLTVCQDIQPTREAADLLVKLRAGAARDAR